MQKHWAILLNGEPDRLHSTLEEVSKLYKQNDYLLGGGGSKGGPADDGKGQATG